jgi:xanthine dehydrogenase FAD-binding subunit
MPEMEFIRPDTLDDVLILLAETGYKKRLIAGGTDIVPGIRQGLARFKHIRGLIDIHHLTELNFIRADKDYLRIGAAVTFSRLAWDEQVRKMASLLADAAIKIGSVQIRNRATIAGNFVNNAPCADSVPPLLVYNARVKLVSRKTQRELLLEQFLKGPYKTVLKADELVSEIIIPLDTQNYHGRFYKLGRRRGVAISRISLALLMQISGNVSSDVRIACGAVTPVGIRLRQLEKSFVNVKLSTDRLKILTQDLAEQILKVSGLRWSTPYKLPVLQQIFYQIMCDLTRTGL